jgi:hypothetical protein
MREVVCSDDLEGCTLEPPNPNKLPNPKDSEELEKPIRFNYPLVDSGAISNSGVPSSYSANNLLPLKLFKSRKRRKIQTSQSSDIHPLTPPPKPKRRSKPKSKSAKPRRAKPKSLDQRRIRRLNQVRRRRRSRLSES